MPAQIARVCGTRLHAANGEPRRVGHRRIVRAGDFVQPRTNDRRWGRNGRAAAVSRRKSKIAMAAGALRQMVRTSVLKTNAYWPFGNCSRSLYTAEIKVLVRTFR